MPIIQVSDQTFQPSVIHANKPVLVDFWAPWCGPCRMIAPILQELAQEFGDNLIIAKLNVDENPLVASRYGIKGIPTLMLFSNGKSVQTIVGLQPKPHLKKMIQTYL